MGGVSSVCLHVVLYGCRILCMCVSVAVLPLLPVCPCVCRWRTALGGDGGEHGATGRQTAFKGTLQRHHVVTTLVNMHASGDMGVCGVCDVCCILVYVK